MNMRFIAVTAAFALAGCSADLSSVELEPASKVDEVNGVPYRVKEPFVVELYKKTDKGYIRVNSDATTSLANPDRLYLLQLEGKPFSDAGLKYEIDADGTLKSVKLSATSGVAKAADTVSSAIGEIEKLSKAVEEAAAKATSGQETKQLNFLKAMGAVRLAEAKLGAMPASASEFDRIAATNALNEAKFNANIAAREAGIARPYPDLPLE